MTTQAMPGTAIQPPPIPLGSEARRRTELRFAHRVPCRVRTREGHTKAALSVIGQTVNLSARGVAVQVGHPIRVGLPVEVLLPHLDGEPMRVTGRVVHSRRVVSGTFEIGISIESDT